MQHTAFPLCAKWLPGKIDVASQCVAFLVRYLNLCVRVQAQPCTWKDRRQGKQWQILEQALQTACSNCQNYCYRKRVYGAYFIALSVSVPLFSMWGNATVPYFWDPGKCTSPAHGSSYPASLDCFSKCTLKKLNWLFLYSKFINY